MEKILLTKKEFKEVMQILNRASKDEVRPILQGLFFNDGEVAAMDGYRLSIRKLPKKIGVKCVIHQNDLKSILKLVKREVENIEIEFDLNYATFKLFDKDNNILNEIKSEYLNGNYPNYKSFIVKKKDFNGVVKINSKELLEVVKPLKTSYNVYIKTEDDKMKVFDFLKTDWQDDITKVKFIESLDIKNVLKKDLTFCLNINFLKETIKDYKDSFKLSYIDNRSQFVIEDLEKRGCYDLILPIRTNRDLEFVY